MIGAAIAGTMALGLHMFGPGKDLAVAFDDGAYLRHVLFAFSPLWALALLSGPIWRKLLLFFTLIAACVIVPSFLYIPNTVTGQIDFSMKIAALIAVAASPLACAGLARSRKNWRSPAAAVTMALIVLGLVCTVAYAGQRSHSCGSGTIMNALWHCRRITLPLWSSSATNTPSQQARL